jgi:phosphate transport system substrate-binding protein
VTYRKLLAATAAGLLAFGVAACGDDDGGGGGGRSSLSGKVAIDGSSTVFPFAQAAAEQFQRDNSNVEITVGESGTGGGFEKFCAGETAITTASRPIEEDEVAACKKKGINYAEIHVAEDGIAIVTNPGVKIDCLTTAQLKKLWNKGSRVESYKDLDPKFPDQKISLFGAGTDSGTFDFFTEQINGEEGATRKDYQPSEDDNVLVEGVAGDNGGLGYFGFSYYESNKDKLNLVGVDGGNGCVKPDKATIQAGEYKPLSRPLFMYPSLADLKKPAVKGFMDYVVDNHEQIATDSQIVPMSSATAEKSKAALSKAS